jgi:hypothetical protein
MPLTVEKILAHKACSEAQKVVIMILMSLNAYYCFQRNCSWTALNGGTETNVNISEFKE